MDKIFGIITVLQKGEELQGSAKWKKVQQYVTFLSAIVIFLAKFKGIELDTETAKTVVDGLTTLIIVVNMYLTPATSSKVGI